MNVQAQIEEFYDVVIIGAGPVGGYLGWKFKELGHTVLIVEEHSEIGRPFQCAGLVNPGAMERVPMKNTILTPIWGARINSPNGTTVDIGSPERIRTWSVCRKKFDEGVVRLAIESGADIILNSKPTKLDIEKDYAEISINVGGDICKVRCDLVCGCDGAHSWVRRTMKMGRPKEMMIGYQVEVTGYNGSSGQLDMFTGIVEEVGKVNTFNDFTLIVECKKILEGIKIGDSISTSGICLTVTNLEGNKISFDLSEETINKSIFGKEQEITHVNLERSATLETRIGGHLVEGHVEETGICREIEKLRESTIITFEVNKNLLENIIEKGYVAIDGTSLTVNKIYDNTFQVSIIPHTLNETTFKNLKINQYVNVETDVNARYIKKYVEDIIKRKSL